VAAHLKKKNSSDGHDDIINACRYIFFKKQSLEQIDPFDILHNMIKQIDPFND
jgi:hypothetical protein